MNQIASVDLLYPGRTPPVGWPPGPHRGAVGRADPIRYVAWIDSGRVTNGRYGFRPELAPRTALHLVACRNGARA